jgi:hypothetical protein
MFKKKFPQSDGSRMLNHILDVYGTIVPKSVFDHLGCGGEFYKECLLKGRIKKLFEKSDPLVRIVRSYEKFEYGNYQIR